MRGPIGMPYLTVLVLVAAPLLVEWAFRRVMPAVWRPLRWWVLPIGNAVLGWVVPMRVLAPLPDVEHVLSAFLGLTFGVLVALWGHHRQSLWSGPTEDEIARTGRRSAYQGTTRRR